MDDFKTLSQLGVSGWNIEKLYSSNEYTSLLAWRKRDHKTFEAMLLDCIGGPVGGELEYQVLFHAEPSWDGMRHLYFGSEDTGNYGYLFWPSLDVLRWGFDWLDKLGLEYCSDWHLYQKEKSQ